MFPKQLVSRPWLYKMRIVLNVVRQWEYSTKIAHSVLLLSKFSKHDQVFLPCLELFIFSSSQSLDVLLVSFSMHDVSIVGLNADQG